MAWLVRFKLSCLLFLNQEIPACFLKGALIAIHTVTDAVPVWYARAI